MVHEAQRGTATRRLWCSANGCIVKDERPDKRNNIIKAAIGMLTIRAGSFPNRRSDLATTLWIAGYPRIYTPQAGVYLATAQLE